MYIRNILFVISLLNGALATAQPSCKTERHIFIEREDVKVWKSTVCPNELLPFHTHDYPRIAIAEENGKLVVLYKDGEKTEIPLTQGVPVYLSKAQGSSPHQDLNPGEKPLHITVVELKYSN
jgi:hypothetical protein